MKNQLINALDLLGEMKKINWGENEGLHQRVIRTIHRVPAKQNYKDVVLCRDCSFCNDGKCEKFGIEVRTTDYCSWGKVIPKHYCGECLHYAETNCVRACLRPLSISKEATIVRVKKDDKACEGFKEKVDDRQG